MPILVIDRSVFLTLAVATEKPQFVKCSSVVYYLVLNCDESKSIIQRAKREQKDTNFNAIGHKTTFNHPSIKPCEAVTQILQYKDSTFSLYILPYSEVLVDGTRLMHLDFTDLLSPIIKIPMFLTDSSPTDLSLNALLSDEGLQSSGL